jgi:hypothetical protein
MVRADIEAPQNARSLIGATSAMLSQFVARASSASRLFPLTHEHEEIRRSTRRVVDR